MCVCEGTDVDVFGCVLGMCLMCVCARLSVCMWYGGCVCVCLCVCVWVGMIGMCWTCASTFNNSCMRLLVCMFTYAPIHAYPRELYVLICVTMI